MQKAEFKFAQGIELRFVDVDALGHVNNANYLTYLEQGRIGYLNEVLGKEVKYEEKGIILAHVAIDFKIPAVFGDRIEVLTRCSRLGNKSFDLTCSIVKLVGSAKIEVSAAHTVLVCFDYEAQQSIPLPQAWIERFTAFEGL